MKRPNAPRLIDIVEAANHVSDFLEGKVFDDFVNDEMLQGAVLWNLVIMGEACAHLSDELRSKYDKIDWVQIKNFRNYVVHEYWGTALHRVWDSATVDAPALRNYCIEIYRAEFPDLLEFLPQ